MLRPRHPRKELETLLRAAEDQGWTVVKGRKYYRCRCPCGEHLKTIHLTPSDPGYARNQRAWFTRQACWKDSTT